MVIVYDGTMNMHLASWGMALALLGPGGEFINGQSNPQRANGNRPKTAKQMTRDDLFPRDRVLDVRITIDEEDWDIIRRQSRNLFTVLNAKRQFEPIEGPYTYVTAKVSIDGVVFPKVGVRKKGFIGSQSSTYPSLKIKLNHVNKKGGVQGLTNLTFNNNKQDGSLVCQFMGYAIFNAAGSPAPRCAYAKVQVNGKNLGVYSHVEAARRPLIERAYANTRGTLYEGTVVDFFEDWEGSFEKKFGPDAPGRKKIKQLIVALKGRDGKAILSSKAIGRAWVPTNGQFDDRWTAPKFKDSKWKRGRNGAGYENTKGFESLISKQFDFQSAMYGKSTSVYLRLPFNVSNLRKVASFGDLILRMKYDDGFVAYLNGHRVASANAPAEPKWDSKATASHDDREATTSQSFVISEHRDKLVKGKNLLAIHGLNFSATSSDMLVVAELETRDFDHEQDIGKLVDLDSFYTFWAVEGLLGFWDGYSANANNFFVYLNPRTKKFHFLPWGADALFVKYSLLGRDPRAPISVKTKGLVAHKLYQLDSGRKRYAKTLERLLDKLWDEKALIAETERIEKMLTPHLSSRQSRLPRAMDRVRAFIRTRRADLEAELSGGMPVWGRVPSPPPVFGGRRRRRP